MNGFKKLKKRIDHLFDPALRMEFCCSAYPLRSVDGCVNHSISRFYLKMDQEIIWYYPENFELNGRSSEWCDTNGISALIQEYVNRPIQELLDKKFSNDFLSFGYRRKGSPKTSTISERDPDIVVALTDAFKAADRTTSKRKLTELFVKTECESACRIIYRRLYKNEIWVK